MRNCASVCGTVLGRRAIVGAGVRAGAARDARGKHAGGRRLGAGLGRNAVAKRG